MVYERNRVAARFGQVVTLGQSILDGDIPINEIIASTHVRK